MIKFLTLFLLNSVIVFGQTPTIDWAKSAGGKANDYGNFICSDVNSNIFVCGEFSSDTMTFGNVQLYNSGSYDVYIAKYDSSGNVLWAKSFGKEGDDFASYICTDLQGNSYLAGSFVSDSLFIENDTLLNSNTDTTEECFIIKFDPNGNVIWSQAFGGLGSDYCYGVSSDLNGNIYMAGYFSSPTILFGSTTLTNTFSGTNDIFLLKFNAVGNKIWAKSIGGINNEEVRGLKTDPNGNIFVIGEYNSPSVTFGSSTLTNNGAYDLFIVKFNSVGNVLWAKSSGGANDEKSISISIDPAGNIYSTGFYLSQQFQMGSFPLNNVSVASNGDIWIAKYNNNGEVLWAKSEGGSLFDKGIGITTDVNGNAYLTGYYKSDTLIFGTDTLLNASEDTRDFYMVKYNTNGNPIWAFSAGGENQDFGFSNCIFGNSLYVTGKFESPNITFGDIVLTNIFNTGITYDIFIVKLTISNSATDVSENDEANQGIHVFPNPSKGEFTLFVPPTANHIQLVNSSEKTVQVINNQGQTEHSLILSNSGIYIIKVTMENKVFTKKIMVIK